MYNIKIISPRRVLYQVRNLCYMKLSNFCCIKLRTCVVSSQVVILCDIVLVKVIECYNSPLGIVRIINPPLSNLVICLNQESFLNRESIQSIFSH